MNATDNARYGATIVRLSLGSFVANPRAFRSILSYRSRCNSRTARRVGTISSTTSSPNPSNTARLSRNVGTLR